MSGRPSHDPETLAVLAGVSVSVFEEIVASLTEAMEGRAHLREAERRALADRAFSHAIARHGSVAAHFAIAEATRRRDERMARIWDELESLIDNPPGPSGRP